MLGTRKGGFILHSLDRRRWGLAGPYFEGVPIYHMFLDPRDGRTAYAAAVDSHWGHTVHRARIGGVFRRTGEAPKFAPDTDLAVERIWHLEPGLPDEPGTLYAGVAPAALFKSDDRGDSWEPLDGLNRHPTRKDWKPGQGGLCLHSILVDPRDSRHLVVGISAVGTWDSRDGGERWTMENQGVRADFLPTRFPEFGQCVHKLAWDSAHDGSIFHQNHCGTYFRGPAGGRWTDVSGGLPSDFGFPIAAHPHRKGTAYVVPLVGAFNRVTTGGQMAVWRTPNRGRTWRKLTRGLPGRNAYACVLREGLATDEGDPVGVYVGTTTGQLYGSRDEGDTWTALAEHLTPILSVSTGAVA